MTQLKCSILSDNIIIQKMRYLYLGFLFWIASCSHIGEQVSMTVTIYNNNYAMVKDVRDITFDQGQSFLYFTDVSSNIQTETVTFKALTDPASVRVYEQNFQKNLVNRNAILQKYIEQEIVVIAEFGDDVRRIQGKLLAFNSGYILQTDFGINVVENVVGIQFPSLPDGFFTTPTLNWKVWSERAQTCICEVAYRTTGFKWKADYSLSLNQDETHADIGGWVTIDNNSGKKYVNAKLKLIAGDVNIVRQYEPYYSLSTRDFSQTNNQQSFDQKSFADYHLYTLSAPVTLNESSQKQVEFIPKVFSVPIWKYHEIEISSGGLSQVSLKAENYLNFFNTQVNGLGIPLPKGIMRVFKEDQDDGSLEFIGEDRIDHTPKNQNITITTGNAFDIAADKFSESRVELDNKESYQARLNMTVRNHKETNAEIVIVYTNRHGGNLQIQWDQMNDVVLEKETSRRYTWRKVVRPNQNWVVRWTETFYSI